MYLRMYTCTWTCTLSILKAWNTVTHVHVHVHGLHEYSKSTWHLSLSATCMSCCLVTACTCTLLQNKCSDKCKNMDRSIKFKTIVQCLGATPIISILKLPWRKKWKVLNPLFIIHSYLRVLPGIKWLIEVYLFVHISRKSEHCIKEIVVYCNKIC